MKNAKIFLSTHSLFTGILGVIFLFLPDLVIQHLAFTNTSILEYLLQLMGGLYLGLAMLSWVSRGQAIGGIYSRPLVMANFTFLLTGTLSTLKTPDILLTTGLFGWILTAYYLFFTVSFTVLLFRSPV